MASYSGLKGDKKPGDIFYVQKGRQLQIYLTVLEKGRPVKPRSLGKIQLSDSEHLVGVTTTREKIDERGIPTVVGVSIETENHGKRKGYDLEMGDGKPCIF